MNKQLPSEIIKILDPSIKLNITTAWQFNEEKNTIIHIFFDSSHNLYVITADFSLLICHNIKLPLPEDFKFIKSATIQSSGKSITWPGEIHFKLSEIKTKTIDSKFFRFLPKSRLKKYDKILDLIDICHYERTKAIETLVLK